MIRVRPARRRRVEFARYVTRQSRGGRMLTEDVFGIPDPVYVHMPERLLIGSVVEGHPYEPVADEPAVEFSPADDLVVGGFELEDDAPAGAAELAEFDGLDELGEDDPAAADTDAGETPGGFACPICNKPMLNAKGVETHLRRRHSDDTPDQTEGEES